MKRTLAMRAIFEKLLSLLFPVSLPSMHHVTVQRFGTEEPDPQSSIGRVQRKQYRDAIQRFNEGGN